jgi:hypothetical protein
VFSGPTYVGTSSPSMGVRVSNSPHSDVKLKLSLANADQTGITFTPDTLTFGAGDTELFYRVNIAADYDTSSANSATIEFEATGTDAEVFTKPANVQFSINDAQEGVTAGSITSFGAPTSPTTGNDVTFSPSVT